MTTWRDDLNRSVGYGWGNDWVETGSSISPLDEPRWYDDGTDGVHRKYVPGAGTGDYGVMQRVLPLDVVGPEQDVLFGFRMHYTGFGEDDRMDFYLQLGSSTAFSVPHLRLRIEFGTLEVRVYNPMTDVVEEIVFDPDFIPGDTDMRVRCLIGPDSVQAKIWRAADAEPGWQLTQPLAVAWVGGTYVWIDPFGASSGDADDDYFRLYFNFVQVSVPETLVTDSRIFYREAWA